MDDGKDPQGTLTVTGRVGVNNASKIINKAKKSESYSLIIPILDLALYPEQEISIEAEPNKNGLILISPPEIILDRPVYIGCFSPFSSSYLTPEPNQTFSHLDCLVLCNKKSKRFALLQETDCFCHSDDSYYQLFTSGSLVPSAQCNITCESHSHSYCGGVDRYSVYVAGKH